MSVSSFNIGCQYTGAFARVALALLMALCCSAVLAAGLDTVLGRSTQEVSVQRLTDVEADATATSLFKRWTDLSATAPRYGVSEGFSKQPVWLRATIIRPEAAKETWWLVFSNALLDRIEIILQLQFVILIVVPALVVMLWRQWRQGVEAAGFFCSALGPTSACPC
jgi:hypothetical protein